MPPQRMQLLQFLASAVYPLCQPWDMLAAQAARRAASGTPIDTRAMPALESPERAWQVTLQWPQ